MPRRIPIQPLDPRAKLLAFGASLLLVSSSPREDLPRLGAYLLVLLLLLILLKTRWWRIVLRLTEVTPLLTLMGAFLAWETASWTQGFGVMLKGWAAFGLVLLLVDTTRMQDLIWAIGALRAPWILSLTMGMAYRYLFVLEEEYAGMVRARLSRNGFASGWTAWRAYGNQLGSLLVRSWEKAERIHGAMLTRGFTGSIPSILPRRLGPGDYWFTAALVTLFAALRFSQR